MGMRGTGQCLQLLFVVEQAQCRLVEHRMLSDEISSDVTSELSDSIVGTEAVGVSAAASSLRIVWSSE